MFLLKMTAASDLTSMFTVAINQRYEMRDDRVYLLSGITLFSEIYYLRKDKIATK